MLPEQIFFVALIFTIPTLVMVAIGRYVWTCLRHNRRAHAAGTGVGPSWFTPLVRR